MSHPISCSLPRPLALVAFLIMLTAADAKMSSWKDVQGKTFKGEPTEILGPLALFNTGSGKGLRVLLRAFSPEDCRRIYAEIAAQPPRAKSFAEATGAATGSLVGKVQRVKDGALVPADLAQSPEPALLMVLGGSHNDGDGWFMSSNLNLFYGRIQRTYPTLMEGVFLGARHDESQHRSIAVTTGMPWLVFDFNAQSRASLLKRYVPTQEGANAVLLSRHGIPLVGGVAGNLQSVCAFIDQVSTLLWQIDPSNPAGWADRLHYANATRPTEFAQSRATPLLIGDPLRPEVMRRYGVKRIAARLAVAPDGKVTPTLLSGPADVPAELAAAVTEVLAQLVVSPAIDHGRAVAGELDYTLDVPHADPRRELEKFWIGSTGYQQLTIPEWLVLRPIQVLEKDFESSVVGQSADGTVILNALEVNAGKVSRVAQMSAFNSDWFAESGVGSVRPKEGDSQRIDDQTILKWEKLRSNHGLVNMQTGVPLEYTVGYAWAEFESPKETEAWLGLGSDDGVKIWLNGELVHDQWVRRPSWIDDDIIPVRLKKGPNRMLIKIQNVKEAWSFVYRLRLKP